MYLQFKWYVFAYTLIQSYIIWKTVWRTHVGDRNWIECALCRRIETKKSKQSTQNSECQRQWQQSHLHVKCFGASVTRCRSILLSVNAVCTIYRHKHIATKSSVPRMSIQRHRHIVSDCIISVCIFFSIFFCIFLLTSFFLYRFSCPCVEAAVTAVNPTTHFRTNSTMFFFSFLFFCFISIFCHCSFIFNFAIISGSCEWFQFYRSTYTRHVHLKTNFAEEQWLGRCKV